MAMTVLCDTEVMIEFLFNTPEVVDQLLRFGFNNIAISPVTIAENQVGERDKSSLRDTMKKLSAIPVVPIDAVISLRFTELFHHYCLSHRPSIPDILIAAIALSYDIEFVYAQYQRLQIYPGTSPG
ncbi:MAG: PIN domain-containing protein [Chitinophagales bacterium]